MHHYICMYIGVNALCMYVCICTYKCMYVCMYACTYVCMCVQVRVYVRTYVCMHVYMNSVDLENFSAKNSYSSYFNEIKTHKIFTMKILFSNNQYNTSSFHSANPCTLNVSDNNIYKAEKNTSFYYTTSYSTDKHTG